MQVAIIGACGYVGSMIYDLLSKNSQFQITCFDSADSDVYPDHIQKKASAISTSELTKFEVVIYLAGLSRKEDCEAIAYSRVHDMNVTEALSVANKLTQSQLFLYASTASLYISQNSKISQESDSIDDAYFGNYEISMLTREKEIHRLSNTRSVGMRFGTVIGISPHPRSELLHIGMFNSAITTRCINVWNPNSERSILWYKDLENALTLIMKNAASIESHSVFNISSFNTSIRETAKSISEKLGCELNILHTNSSLGFHCSNSKFSAEFDYKFIGTNDTIADEFLNNKDVLINSIINPVGKHVTCLVCNSILLNPILDLGSQPLANDFADMPGSSERFPLVMNGCESCYHRQLNYFVDREVLFKNYIYESGTSKTLRDYFATFAELYTSKLGSNNTVLEIACNDGFQLEEFKKRGWKTYGVDPAENIVPIARNKGHIVHCGFWGKDPIDINITPDLIVAENVLAHVNNPIDFLNMCVSVMNDKTLLVIQTSQANIFTNNEFDTIYHEHISFFTIRSMKKAVSRVGCYIENIYKPSIHGTSYVFEIRKGRNNVELPLLLQEEADGMYTDSFYTKYGNAVHAVRDNTLNELQEYAHNGYSIIAYGAAAKGITFLNYVFNCDGTNSLAPEVIIDDSNVKKNKFTPGMNIVVKDIGVLKNYEKQKLLIIVTAWNFFDEIFNRTHSYITENSIDVECVCVRFYPDVCSRIIPKAM
jgi:nucleoside-diphosphate-sugar epimerase/2-polyprenyl-3-methyl-5-hydroxy-6-metoxy-1,4-benzoquinol methylase